MNDRTKLICKPVFNTLQKHISPRWLMVMIFPILILNAWLVIKTLQYFQPLVAIVILAALLAFILNYPVQFLQQHGNRHSIAVVVVFLLTLLILMELGITLVPRLIEELSQIVVDQTIAPRLLGRFTGLRPAWILIALFIGTKLFGWLGLIVSVPLAGFVKDTLHELRNASVNTVIGLEAPATSDHSPLEKQQVQQL